MRVLKFLASLCLCGALFGQLDKNQLLELVQKQVDHVVILDLVKSNCVSFELDATLLVELSSALPTPILQAVLDCKGVGKANASPALEGLAGRPSARAFPVHASHAISFDSNKSSYRVLEVEMRLQVLDVQPATELRYHFKGETGEESVVTVLKNQGPDFLEPCRAKLFLYVVSERNRGLLARKALRTDLHQLSVEYQGSGPIVFAYRSTEDRTFKASKETSISVSGPMVIQGEDKVSLEGVRPFDDVFRLFAQPEKP
jgi:hypothetical protein